MVLKWYKPILILESYINNIQRNSGNKWREKIVLNIKRQ